MRIRRFNESKETESLEYIFQSIIDLVEDREDLFEVEFRGNRFGLRINHPNYLNLEKTSNDYSLISRVVSDLNIIIKNLDLDGIKYEKSSTRVWIHIKLIKLESEFDSIFSIPTDTCVVNINKLKEYFGQYAIDSIDDDSIQFEDYHTLIIYLDRTLKKSQELKIRKDLEESTIIEYSNFNLDFDYYLGDTNENSTVIIKIEDYSYEY